jgi:hypothetical protein
MIGRIINFFDFEHRERVSCLYSLSMYSLILGIMFSLLGYYLLTEPSEFIRYMKGALWECILGFGAIGFFIYLWIRSFAGVIRHR